MIRSQHYSNNHGPSPTLSPGVIITVIGLMAFIIGMLVMYVWNDWMDHQSKNQTDRVERKADDLQAKGLMDRVERKADDLHPKDLMEGVEDKADDLHPEDSMEFVERKADDLHPKD